MAEEFRIVIGDEKNRREITVSGGDLDVAHDMDKSILAIGRITAHWARFECHLNTLLIHLNTPRFSEELYEEQHPRNFSQKLKLLRKWINSHPALSGIEDYSNDFLYMAKEASKLRNQITHGMIDKFNKDQDYVEIITVQYDGGGVFSSDAIEFKYDNMLFLIDRIKECNNRLVEISRCLLSPEAIKFLERTRKNGIDAK